MICPNCGSEQPESFECVKCGVIFAKFEERQARIRDGQMPRQDRWSRSLGGTARLGRILVGVAAIGMAVLMFLNGTAAKAFGPFVAFVFFAGAGLYFLISFKEKMPVLRFAVEAGCLALVSVFLFVSLPGVFSLGKPMYESTVAVRPPSEPRVFLRAARDRLDSIRKFMDLDEVENTEDAVAVSMELEGGRLETPFSKVPAVDKDIMYPVFARLTMLRPLVDTLVKRFPSELPAGPAKWVPDAVAADVHAQLDVVDADLRELERQIAAREEAIRTGALGNTVREDE